MYVAPQYNKIAGIPMQAYNLGYVVAKTKWLLHLKGKNKSVAVPLASGEYKTHGSR